MIIIMKSSTARCLQFQLGHNALTKDATNSQKEATHLSPTYDLLRKKACTELRLITKIYIYAVLQDKVTFSSNFKELMRKV